MPQQEQNRPASPHAEQTILGGMLVEPASILDAIDILEADSFALDSHRRIFAAILYLHTDRQSVDIVTVAEELKRRKELESVGGVPYIASLSEGLPRKLSIQSYVRIVKDKAMMREAMVISERTTLEASDQSESAVDVIQRSITDLRNLVEDTSDNDLLSAGDYMRSQGEPEQILETLTTGQGVKLGWPQWDETTSGMQDEDLIIIAARPSMGKTAWACNAAYFTSVVGGRVTAFFTLEQSRKTMIRRMLASSARIDYQDIRKGLLRSHDRGLLMERRHLLAQAPLYLEDQRGLTVTRIRAKCLRLQRQQGLDIVFIDQLSHVNRADVFQKGMPKHEQVGEQTRMLKLMAKELGVPVVLFNQLNRDVGKRTDPTPRLIDLAESGSLEQDGDVIGFLHRPEYYDKKDEALRGLGQMIIAKQREGPTKTIECNYDAKSLRWEDESTPEAQQDTFYSSREY